MITPRRDYTHKSSIPCAVTQKDLGFQVNKSPSWNDYCLTRTRKLLRALFTPKRNSSTNCSLVVRMNANTGYIVPILSFYSQAWFLSIAVCKHSVRNQKIAVRWFFTSSDDFKKIDETETLTVVKVFSGTRPASITQSLKWTLRREHWKVIKIIERKILLFLLGSRCYSFSAECPSRHCKVISTCCSTQGSRKRAAKCTRLILSICHPQVSTILLEVCSSVLASTWSR